MNKGLETPEKIYDIAADTLFGSVIIKDARGNLEFRNYRSSKEIIEEPGFFEPGIDVLSRDDDFDDNDLLQKFAPSLTATL